MLGLRKPECGLDHGSLARMPGSPSHVGKATWAWGRGEVSKEQPDGTGRQGLDGAEKPSQLQSVSLPSTQISLSLNSETGRALVALSPVTQAEPIGALGTPPSTPEHSAGQCGARPSTEGQRLRAETKSSRKPAPPTPGLRPDRDRKDPEGGCWPALRTLAAGGQGHRLWPYRDCAALTFSTRNSSSNILCCRHPTC